MLQRLRALIGYNPRQAVGGSRSGSAGSVCLITPRFQVQPDGTARAVVTLPRPTLLAAGDLNEMRLERGGRIVWQKRASSTEPISGPISWPIEPLLPAETVLLRLRPRGAAGSDFATIELLGASAVEQQQAEALLSDPRQRLAVIETQARKGRSSLASELVFSPLPQPPSGLVALRRDLLAQGCGITPPTR